MGECFCEKCRPDKYHMESATNDSWELTPDELGNFLLVANTLKQKKPVVPLEDFISNPVFRDILRHAFEKLMAQADSRRVLTDSQKELKYLKGRIRDAKGWLRLGMTHKLWGSITDGYAALDNGRMPPVKTWQAAGEWVAEDGIGLVVTAAGKAKAKARAKKKKAQPKRTTK